MPKSIILNRYNVNRHRFQIQLEASGINSGFYLVCNVVSLVDSILIETFACKLAYLSTTQLSPLHYRYHDNWHIA